MATSNIQVTTNFNQIFPLLNNNILTVSNLPANNNITAQITLSFHNSSPDFITTLQPDVNGNINLNLDFVLQNYLSTVVNYITGNTMNNIITNNMLEFSVGVISYSGSTVLQTYTGSQNYYALNAVVQGNDNFNIYNYFCNSGHTGNFLSKYKYQRNVCLTSNAYLNVLTGNYNLPSIGLTNILSEWTGINVNIYYNDGSNIQYSTELSNPITSNSILQLNVSPACINANTPEFLTRSGSSGSTGTIVLQSNFSNWDHSDYGFEMPDGFTLIDQPNNIVPTTSVIAISNVNNAFKFLIHSGCTNTLPFVVKSNTEILVPGTNYNFSFDIIETSNIDGYVDIGFSFFNESNTTVISDGGTNLKTDIVGHYSFNNTGTWPGNENFYMYFLMLDFDSRDTDAYIIIDNLVISQTNNESNIQPQVIGSKLLSLNTAINNLINANTVYYTVQDYNNQSEVIQFNVCNETKVRNPWCILYVNSLGCTDYMDFVKASQKDLQITRNTFINNSYQKVYSQDIDLNINVTSDWLTEEQSLATQDLWNSPAIMISNNGFVYPAVIANDKVTVMNRFQTKLMSYEIEFQPSITYRSLKI